MGPNFMSLPTELHMRIVEFVGYTSIDSIEQLQKTGPYFDDLVRRFWACTDAKVLRVLWPVFRDFVEMRARVELWDSARSATERDELWKARMCLWTRSEICKKKTRDMTVKSWWDIASAEQ